MAKALGSVTEMVILIYEMVEEFNQKTLAFLQRHEV